MKMRTDDLFTFIVNRYDIYVKKTAGKPKPWTTDTILQQYRFCNVYRELDTVTRWISDNWRTPNKKDKHLWFAMVVARLLNWPATLETLGYPVPWNARMSDRFSALERMGKDIKVFSGAYIVSTNGKTMAKIPYLRMFVLDPLWGDRDLITAVIQSDPTLAQVHKTLMKYDGLGSFMAAQVIADLKYVKPLRDADDWYTWAAPGPGSRRGLNRVMGRELTASWQDSVWLENLQLLHAEIAPLVKRTGLNPIHAQDLQNCLCEFDKYERTRLGEGTPRSKYSGGKGE